MRRREEREGTGRDEALRAPATPGAAGWRADDGHAHEGAIHAWLDAALDVGDAAALAAHADACATCAARVAEARGLLAGASRILTALDAVPGDVIPAGSSMAGVTPVGAPPVGGAADRLADDTRATRDPRPVATPWLRRAAAVALLVAGGGAAIVVGSRVGTGAAAADAVATSPARSVSVLDAPDAGPAAVPAVDTLVLPPQMAERGAGIDADRQRRPSASSSAVALLARESSDTVASSSPVGSHARTDAAPPMPASVAVEEARVRVVATTGRGDSTRADPTARPAAAPAPSTVASSGAPPAVGAVLDGARAESLARSAPALSFRRAERASPLTLTRRAPATCYTIATGEAGRESPNDLLERIALEGSPAVHRAAGLAFPARVLKAAPAEAGAGDAGVAQASWSLLPGDSVLVVRTSTAGELALRLGAESAGVRRGVARRMTPDGSPDAIRSVIARRIPCTPDR